MPKISDALLFDLLSCFRLKQISLAIEVLRGRVTADQLVSPRFSKPSGVEVRRTDELSSYVVVPEDEIHENSRYEHDCPLDLGHGDHEEGEYA